MSVAALIEVFDATFAESEGTRLVRGDGEPIYEPRNAEIPFDRICFAHGFFASGLHEIAHWCVAGAARRRLTDYGYWYRPDGRSEDEQREFERVEAKPQAIEWILSVAAGVAFNVSADNLGAQCATPPEARLRFHEAVARQALAYLEGGLPPRARRFAEALAARFGTGDAWRRSEFYRVVL